MYPEKKLFVQEACLQFSQFILYLPFASTLLCLNSVCLNPTLSVIWLANVITRLFIHVCLMFVHLITIHLFLLLNKLSVAVYEYIDNKVRSCYFFFLWKSSLFHHFFYKWHWNGWTVYLNKIHWTVCVSFFVCNLRLVFFLSLVLLHKPKLIWRYKTSVVAGSFIWTSLILNPLLSQLKPFLFSSKVTK